MYQELVDHNHLDPKVGHKDHKEDHKDHKEDHKEDHKDLKEDQWVDLHQAIIMDKDLALVEIIRDGMVKIQAVQWETEDPYGVIMDLVNLVEVVHK
jgi:hypothetical protein